jgi:hypothetical protein
MKKLASDVRVGVVSEVRRFSISENGAIISKAKVRDNKDGKPVYLFGLRTNKSHRRRYCATELLNSIIKTYSDRGITLKVFSEHGGPSNNTLMNIYRKFGFKRKGKTNVMYVSPPRKWEEGDRTRIKCPNCGNCMTITPMPYYRYYRDAREDICEITSDYDPCAMQCKKCELSYAGGCLVKYKGFSTNQWSPILPLKEWIDDINQGKGKNRNGYG